MRRAAVVSLALFALAHSLGLAAAAIEQFLRILQMLGLWHAATALLLFL